MQGLKRDNMSENIEKLMYETSLRVRLFRNSKGMGKHVAVLTPRERLLVERIGMRNNMSISEISQLCPTVSNSTISTTITRLINTPWSNQPHSSSHPNG